MKLRKAESDEFNRVRDFYWDLIDRMQGRTDSIGWQKGVHPSDEFLRESIDGGYMYLLDEANRDAGECDKDEAGEILAAVVLNSDWNDGYNDVPWSVDCPPENVMIIHALAVRPDLQGQGVGRRIVKEIIEIARQNNMKTIRLDSLSRNTAAVRLYTGGGFDIIQRKRLYYEDTGLTDFILYEMVL